MSALTVVQVFRTRHAIKCSAQLRRYLAPCRFDLRQLGWVGQEHSFELVGLNVRKKLPGPASHKVDHSPMEGVLDGLGASQWIRFLCRLGPTGELGWKTVQVEEGRDVGVLSFSKRVPQETQHPLTGQATARGRLRSRHASRTQEDRALTKGRRQDSRYKPLLGPALADNRDMDQGAGPPPTTPICHNAPSE